MVGRIISHYKITAKLGQGGIGLVYKAQDTKLQRTVALKILRPEAVGDPDARKRFLREARAASVLNHPNITTIYEIDTWYGRDFIVMEYIEGETLKKIIHNSELRIMNVVNYAIQIAEALKEAHKHRIIHRDIKSENLIVTPVGRVKVMDFGLAKVAGSMTKTKVRTTMGTIAYMSPEQTRGDPLDFSTDIWSFGVVLYEMICGELPFKGGYEQAVIYSILNKTPTKLSTLRSDTPTALEHIVSKALSKSRKERFESAGDVLIELNSIFGHPKNSFIVTALKSFPKSKKRLIGWIASILILFTILVFMNTFQDESSTKSPQTTHITSFEGAEIYPALSPDGTKLAFTWHGEGLNNWDIYIKLIEENDCRRLSFNPAIEYGPTWHNNGNRFAFVRLGDEAGIYMNTIFGGRETKIVALNHTSNHADIVPFVDWAPDGQWLVYNDYDSLATNHAIYKLDLNTHKKERLTCAPPEVIGDMNPKISPNSKWVAFSRVYSIHVCYLFLLNLSNRKVRALTFDKQKVDDLAWISNKKIAFVSNRDGISRLWSIQFNGKQLEPLHIEGQDAFHISISRHSHQLVYSTDRRRINIWQVDIHNTASDTIRPDLLISSSKVDIYPAFSPDDKKIAFVSDRTGYREIFVCNRDALDPPVQLTFLKSSCNAPKWSPSGEQIVFDSRPDGHGDIFLVDALGEKIDRLTNHPADDRLPSWSKDGRYIYFGSKRTGIYQIHRIPANGGDAVQITQNGGFFGYESFDGKFLFYRKFLELTGPIYQINLQSNQQSIVIEDYIYHYRWTTNPEGIYYIPESERDESILKLYRYPERTIERLGIIKKAYRFWDVSADAHHILLWQYDDYSSDIILVDHFW